MRTKHVFNTDDIAEMLFILATLDSANWNHAAASLIEKAKAIHEQSKFSDVSFRIVP